MIEIEHVSQVFQTSSRQDHLALSDISLTIEDGAFVSILGPSGCGKSTLLYIVGGFVQPTQGIAKMKGRAITGPGPDRGPVFQEFALFPWKSVLGNVMYGPRQQGIKHAEAEAQSRALIEMVGLKGFEDFYPKELSGGMKQRVALARTLAYHPEVLLMDEPFGALDAHTRTRLQNDLLNIWERDRKTVLFVTHSVEEAVFLSDKVVMMTRSPGRVRQIVDIELPRPRRRTELLLDPRYQKYVVDIERMFDDSGEAELRPCCPATSLSSVPLPFWPASGCFSPGKSFRWLSGTTVSRPRSRRSALFPQFLATRKLSSTSSRPFVVWRSASAWPSPFQFHLGY